VRLRVLLGDRLPGYRAVLRRLVRRLLLMDPLELSHRAGRVWRHRERAERVAAARFRRLAAELARAGARDVVVTLARKAAEDETRHAEICVALAARFGVACAPHDDGVHDDDHAACPVGPSGLTPRERLLYEVIAMCCVTETISAAALGRMLERAEDPVVRRAVHDILRDEVGHARLGWAHLAAESARGARSVVTEYLPAMLEETAGAELMSAPPDGSPTRPSLAGRGALGQQERRAIFVDTLQSVVLPGLERFGVDTSGATSWLDRRLGASPVTPV
jgi:hypothetical protein